MARPAAPARAFLCALPGILTELNRASHDDLGGGPPGSKWEDISKKILANSWGVNSAGELTDMLRWLSETGHTSEYLDHYAQWRDAPADSKRATHALVFVDEMHELVGDRGLMAWDLCRLVAMAGWGVRSGMITEDEAWKWIVPAGKKLQKNYRSWEDLGRGYVLGATYWRPDAGQDCDRLLTGLMSRADSPWRTLPWGTDLDATEGLAEQGAAIGAKLVAVAVTAISGLAVGCLGLICVGAMLAYLATQGAFEGLTALSAGGGEPTSGGGAGPGPGVPAWDGTAPYSCGGHDKVEIVGTAAKFTEGVAVNAGGHCELTLIDVKIDAPTAIQAGGNAKVTVQSGQLTGGEAAVNALANSKVTLAPGVQVTGELKHSLNAKITGP